MRTAFDCGEPYYLPQYVPVINELTARGHDVSIATYQSLDLAGLASAAAVSQVQLSDDTAALHHYHELRPDWIVFGNGWKRLNELPSETRTALLYHGIGVKESYYEADLCGFDVRFVEGDARLRALAERYPQENFVATGFAKLDELINPTGESRVSLETMELRPDRKTILYAPTFFPSSVECLPDDFPAQLPSLNLIVKPHFFSLTRPRYARQREKYARWARYDNVHLVPESALSILPFMAIADLLVSEASSTIFEFAALDRPVVWCDFYRLRWSYRGPFRYRLRKRMDANINRFADIAAHASSPRHLVEQIQLELENPMRLSASRQRYVRELVGEVDGKASLRIADYLERSHSPASDRIELSARDPALLG